MFASCSFKSVQLVWRSSVQQTGSVTVGRGWQSVARVCVWVCAGHWGSLFTFDPGLDHLTPVWTSRLAPAAEQRVLLAPLLAESLNLCSSAPVRSRNKPRETAQMDIMHTVCWRYRLLFLHMSSQHSNQIMSNTFHHTSWNIYALIFENYEIVHIQSRGLWGLKARYIIQSRALTNSFNWLKTLASALIGCWPCLCSQKGQLDISLASCSAAHGY